MQAESVFCKAGSSQQDTVVGFLISQIPSKMIKWSIWRERIQVSTVHMTEISRNFYWILCGWMVLHWSPVGTLVLKASHIWNANGKRPSRFPSREKGNEVGREAISHTFFGLPPILRALWKPKVTIQAPTRDHTLIAFCRSSLPVLLKAVIPVSLAVFTSVHKGRRRGGEGLRSAVKYCLSYGFEQKGGAWDSNGSRCFSGDGQWMPPYWVRKTEQD